MILRNFTLGAILTSLLMLAACGPTLPPKNPHVSIEAVSHPVQFTAHTVRMSQSERASLGDFAGTFSASSVTHVVLAATDMSSGSVARARNIRDYLVAHGIDKNLIRLQPVNEIDAHTVVVTVQYSKGVPPAPCPDWSKNAAIDYQSAGGSNFGCASNNNFILQLANPEDYNGGHSVPVSEGSRDSAIIQKYNSNTGAAAGGGSSSSAGTSAGGSTSTTTSTP